MVFDKFVQDYDLLGYDTMSVGNLLAAFRWGLSFLSSV